MTADGVEWARRCEAVKSSEFLVEKKKVGKKEGVGHRPRDGDRAWPTRHEKA